MASAVKDDTVSDLVLQMAVLLQSGLSPARAWGCLADAGDQAAARIQAALEQGVPVARAVAEAGPAPRARGRGRRERSTRVRETEDLTAWRDLSAAWQVAIAVGAPLAETLRALSRTLRDAQETADDVRVALAEPAATARLMGWLPLVAVLLGVALGFDTIGTLVGSPIGIVCLAGGIVLLVTAQRWNAALVRRARAAGGIPGLAGELLAIALSGGVSIERAQRLVADATGAEPGADTRAVLDLSRTAGVPAAELLRASSSLARHRARVDGRLRAARLSSRLLIPLGVCTLPAFLLLGVAPMLLSVVSSVPLPF
jgi:tight adherence protein B